MGKLGWEVRDPNLVCSRRIDFFYAPSTPQLGLAKQLAKADARHQNAAAVTHTAAKGASVTVAIIGLIALVVGIIASSGLLITLGSIVLVVGLVLLLLSAL